LPNRTNCCSWLVNTSTSRLNPKIMCPLSQRFGVKNS
jgi:hypothetical protein